jgi:hypothetical protein
MMPRKCPREAPSCGISGPAGSVGGYFGPGKAAGRGISAPAPGRQTFHGVGRLTANSAKQR